MDTDAALPVRLAIQHNVRSDNCFMEIYVIILAHGNSISHSVHGRRPQKELAGRNLCWPRGKILGGSSSINAMMYQVSLYSHLDVRFFF